MVLFTGTAASGKSQAAETLCLSLSKNAAYVATMQPFGAEAEKKIARHLKLRAGKGLATVEQYTDIAELARAASQYDLLLIECITNLTANEMFRHDSEPDSVVQKITEEMRILKNNFTHIIAVTCDVSSDGIVYGCETELYKEYLGKINQALAAMADSVIEVFYGIEIERKSLSERK